MTTTSVDTQQTAELVALMGEADMTAVELLADGLAGQYEALRYVMTHAERARVEAALAALD